ncbi:MAG: hypothetical protein DRQ54_11425 [Gammaproteobacteria bacterium]|nr:MAG: hypothetical protein DRQ54_11425 [Gammaproteobacteria bacterium]
MINVKIQIADFNKPSAYTSYEKGVIRQEVDLIFHDFPLPVRVRVTFHNWKSGEREPCRRVKITPTKLSMMFRESIEHVVDAQCEKIVSWLEDFPDEVKEKYPTKKTEELG